VVRPVLAGKDCDGDDLGLPPWQDFHVWEQPGFDGIGDQAGRTFFLHHRVAHAAHCPGGVFDADRQLAASRVGRGDQGAQHARRRIGAALEFKRIAFDAAEQLGQVHYCEIYPKVAGRIKLPSLVSIIAAFPQR